MIQNVKHQLANSKKNVFKNKPQQMIIPKNLMNNLLKLIDMSNSQLYNPTNQMNIHSKLLPKQIIKVAWLDAMMHLSPLQYVHKASVQFPQTKYQKLKFELFSSSLTVNRSILTSCIQISLSSRFWTEITSNECSKYTMSNIGH